MINIKLYLFHLFYIQVDTEWLIINEISGYILFPPYFGSLLIPYIIDLILFFYIQVDHLMKVFFVAKINYYNLVILHFVSVLI